MNFWEEERIVFLLGTVVECLDSTSSIASGTDGINLSLCSLDCHWLIIVTILVEDGIVILVNSISISIHISIITLVLYEA